MLLKFIYGLKQECRSWKLIFDEVVKYYGFLQNKEESCVYKKLKWSSVTFLVSYVDDMFFIENDVTVHEFIKE